jgi:DNA-binding MarR family transcriptional regulator
VSGDPDIMSKELQRLVRMLKRSRMHSVMTMTAGVRVERPSLDILGVLRDKQPLRIGAIAEELQVESPHVTRHVAWLERHGYVERIQDPRDGRAWLIRLTPSGLDIVSRCSEVTRGWITDVLAAWPEEDRKELARLLPQLVDDLDDYFQRLYGS